MHVTYTESVSKPMMDNIQNMHVEVGDTVIINCWVEMASNIKFNMNWMYPNTKEENRIFESNTTHKNVNVGNLKQIQYKYERNLTIHNATHRDEGEYTCRIVDHNGNTNNVSHYMKVYGMFAS
ncbi:unnamed protein product, partial [Timema podura]|nr:unnamed protein product [Timema podura]